MVQGRKNNWLPTDRRMDKPSYKVSSPRLKTNRKKIRPTPTPLVRLCFLRLYLVPLCGRRATLGSWSVLALQPIVWFVQFVFIDFGKFLWFFWLDRRFLRGYSWKEDPLCAPSGAEVTPSRQDSLSSLRRRKERYALIRKIKDQCNHGVIKNGCG